ncbi:MAG: hypothetical protein P4L40_01915 [Terracidiphilus sp.]|nr:hypothetical protein [Terracidiphilus sp.]
MIRRVWGASDCLCVPLLPQCAPSESIVATDENTCSAAVMQACVASGTNCITENPYGLCACRGKFDACFYDAGCPASTVNSMVALCTNAGCFTAECTPWSS